MPNLIEPPSGPNGLYDYKARTAINTGHKAEEHIREQLTNYHDTKKGVGFKGGFVLGVAAFGIIAGAQILFPELRCYAAAISASLSVISIGLLTNVLRKQKKIVSDIEVSTNEAERLLDNALGDSKGEMEEQLRKVNDHISMN